MSKIKPLNEIQTYRYIDHRLIVAGRRGPTMFERKALKTIWRYSGGIPRLINSLCDNALLDTYLSGTHTVSAFTVKAVARRLNLTMTGRDWNFRHAFTFNWLSARSS